MPCGALQSINSGFMQNEILEAAYQAQRAIETGEKIVVGVNEFQVDEVIELEALSVDPKVEENQKRQLAELRASRTMKPSAFCWESWNRLPAVMNY